MTPRVNLLPERYVVRLRDRRQLFGVGGALALMLVVLVVLALVQASQLRDAEDQRAAEEAAARQLESRRVELEPFRDLAHEVEDGEEALTAAMSQEVSFGGLLSELSAVVPEGTSLTALSLDSEQPTALVADADDEFVVVPGDEEATVGSATVNGYSVDGFAPGLSAMLNQLDAMTGMSEPRLPRGADDVIGDTPVTSFEGAARVDGEALTGRFLDGLPPDERPDLRTPPDREPPTPPAPRDAEAPPEEDSP